jgi:hypothetical protein
MPGNKRTAAAPYTGTRSADNPSKVNTIYNEYARTQHPEPSTRLSPSAYNS